MLSQVTTNGSVDFHSKLHLGFPVFTGKVEGTGILEWVLLIFLSAYKRNKILINHTDCLKLHNSQHNASFDVPAVFSQPFIQKNWGQELLSNK